MDRNLGNCLQWRMLGVEHRNKQANHVRYRLSVGLWGVEVISASKRPVWKNGAKNITVYFKLTRSWGDCWSSCPISLLINKIKIVSDIGWSSAISAWNCHLIHNNDIGLLSTVAMERLHWSLFCQEVCQKIFGRIFQVRFATGRVFKVHFSLRTSFPYTMLCTMAGKY